MLQHEFAVQVFVGERKAKPLIMRVRAWNFPWACWVGGRAFVLCCIMTIIALFINAFADLFVLLCIKVYI